MRVSRLSGLEIVEEEKQFDKPFFVPGLGNCDLDKRDHDLIHALFYLKKDIYDGKTIQEYLADWHLIPSSFTCQGNEFYMNDEVVEDLLPYLALNSLEIDLEDQENQKVVEEYGTKHSDLSKQLINELFAVLLVSKTDEFEGSFEDLGRRMGILGCSTAEMKMSLGC